MSFSMKAVIHLEKNVTEKMTVFKNTDIEEIRNLFSITQRFVMGHTEDSECERNREY